MAQVQPGDDAGGTDREQTASDSHRPPRPSMSDTTPAPAAKPIVVSGVIRVSMNLWLTSFVFGLMVAAFAFLSRNRLMDRLVDIITATQADRAEETIRRAAEAVFWGSLIALIAIVIIEALLVRAMVKRHGSVRFVLILALILHVVIALLADDFVGIDGEGIWFRALLVVQLISAGAALVASFLPGSRAWFRGK